MAPVISVAFSYLEGTYVTFVPVSEQPSNSSEEGNSCANFAYRFTCKKYDGTSPGYKNDLQGS